MDHHQGEVLTIRPLIKAVVAVGIVEAATALGGENVQCSEINEDFTQYYQLFFASLGAPFVGTTRFYCGALLSGSSVHGGVRL